ncbi:hypothetical protein EQU24_09690 [Methylotuvimicrobium buryatense]|uniref:Uncharacterized protein n=1 Tax=Methylotuvimicrobium buryatense TaxID=95641 RepID=A0A4V1IJT0_METBY|nr:hypothetical protein EQU24_09690 [Methylotuvimicrobium buryatense]
MLGEDGVRAAAKPPWMGLRRSSTGIPHTLKSMKLLKLGIAGAMQEQLPRSKNRPNTPTPPYANAEI